MRSWVIWSLIGVVVLALLLRFTVLAPDPIPIQVVRVGRGTVESTVTNTKAGTIEARRRALMSSEAGGRVVEILHREGDRVNEGDLLIRLNDATQKAQLKLAEENLRAVQASRHEACVSRDRARRELERNRKLAAKQIVSADGLDKLESAHKAAQASCRAVAAQVDHATAQIAVAESELRKLEMRAPFDGVIAEVSVEVGEWVTPSPPMLTAPAVIDVIDPSSYYVSAPMDEVDSASIEKGQRAKITVDSHADQEFIGTVSRVAPYVLDVEAQNRTVEIEVEFDDRDFASKLLPGTSADVEVILESREGVLRLPSAALLEGDRVFLANNGRLTEQQVKVGLKNWNFVEIREGLDVDQRVVLSLDRVGVEAGASVEIEEPDETAP